MTFPLHLLPASIQEAVRAVQAMHNTPVEMSTSVALATVAYAAQGLADIDCLAFGSRPISEFFMVLAPSGGAKTTIFKAFNSAIHDHEAKALDAFYDALDTYNVAKASWDQDHNIASKIKESADRLDRLADLQAIKPHPPLDPRRIIEKATPVGLFRKMETAEPSLAIFSAEGGQFLASHSFKSDSGQSTELAATLTALWDGDGIDRNNSSENARLNGRRLSMMVMVQEQVGAEFLNNRVFQSQGIHARILLTQCPKWEIPKLDLSAEATARKIKLQAKLQAFDAKIAALLAKPLNTTTDPREIDNVVIGFDHVAKMHMQDWFNGGPHAAHGEGPFFARQFEHACRLAGMLTVFEGNQSVKLAEAKAATGLVDYYADQWRSLDVEGPNERHADEKPVADRVIAWMRKLGRPITKTDFNTKAPRCFRLLNQDKRVRIIKAMIDWEMIEAQEVVTGNNRTTEQWVAL